MLNSPKTAPQSATPATLYQLSQLELELERQFDEALAENYGELTEAAEALEQELLDTRASLQSKLASYGRIIKNKEARTAMLMANSQSFTDEASRLSDQAGDTQAQIDRMKEHVLFCVDQAVPEPKRGPKRIEAGDFVFQINRAGAAPLIVDVPNNELPPEYVSAEVHVRGTWANIRALSEAEAQRYPDCPFLMKAPTANKALIKEHLDTDPELEGKAHLGEQKKTLVIK